VSRAAPRHAKPKRRRGPLLLLVVLVLVGGGAVGAQRSHWWARAQSEPVATATPSISAVTVTPAVVPTPSATKKPVPPGPAALAPLLPGRASGEGKWVPVVYRSGRPAIEVTWLRSDFDPASRVSIAWIDQSQVRFQLRPGTANPGVPAGSTASPWLPPSEQVGLAAAFNGGFRMVDSFGGFYLNGQVVRPLWTGSASAVIYRDGHIDVGAWGKELQMTSDVESVRQELYLLLDNGVDGPNLTSRVVLQWGGIVGPSYHVWRSAIGVTAKGDLLYVCGPNLAPDELVRVFRRAGAVRAMELDINPYWVTFVWFAAAPSGALTPHRLALFQQPATRYTAAPSNRDFFAVYLR